MKKVLFSLLAVAIMISCVGCKKKNNTNSNADLKITFFNGGYGEDWIHNLAKRFEEANNCTVEIVKSEEGNLGAENFIKSGYNLSDIYIGEGIPWQSLVQGGYLESLEDVYEANVETRSGVKKVKEFMDQNIVGYFYSQRQLKIAEYKPYAMPWSAKPNGMAYNEDVLLKLRHVSEIAVTSGCVDTTTGLWVNVPQTYQDYCAFCEDVINFNNGSVEKGNDTHNYVPLGWCGSVNADSISFMVLTWWAELQGLYESNYEGQSSYYDFFNYGNTVDSNVHQEVDLNVYYQTGLELAYNYLADMLIDSTTKKYKNTIEDPYNINLQQLQQLFVANKIVDKPVISIASSYLENEVIKNKYIDSDSDGVQDVNFKFMNIPSINAGAEKLLALNFSDSMIIPAKAAHKDLAKKFLIFMSSEEEVDNFAKDTNGGIRPFECDLRTAVTGTEYTAFTNSLFDVYYNSTHFYEYPAKTTSLAQVSHLFRYENPTYHGNLAWLDILNILRDPGNTTPGKKISSTIVTRLEDQMLDAWIRRFQLVNKAK